MVVSGPRARQGTGRRLAPRRRGYLRGRSWRCAACGWRFGVRGLRFAVCGLQMPKLLDDWVPHGTGAVAAGGSSLRGGPNLPLTPRREVDCRRGRRRNPSCLRPENEGIDSPPTPQVTLADAAATEASPTRTWDRSRKTRRRSSTRRSQRSRTTSSSIVQSYSRRSGPGSKERSGRLATRLAFGGLGACST